MATWREEAALRPQRQTRPSWSTGGMRKRAVDHPIIKIIPPTQDIEVACEEQPAPTIEPPVDLGDQTKPFTREKHSLGIACVRFNDNGRPEILLVRKRITYAFNLFVHGRYNTKSNQDLIRLFSQMTIAEKLDILSRNFMQIWYRVWLNNTTASEFLVAKNKFEMVFSGDGGARLKKLIAKSATADLIWEIPKGKKKKPTEPDLNCAVREFQEETGLALGSYQLFPQARKSYTHIDQHVKYTNTYFIAYAFADAKINFNLTDQVAELSGIQWMTIDAIRVADPTGKLEKFCRPIFNYIKKYVR